MNLYTAQVRYSGKDRLDITVKSATGAARLVAPTWGMVNAFKSGKIDEHQYARLYYSILGKTGQQFIKWLQEEWLLETVTFVCYCPAHTFCHRRLLAGWIQDEFGWPFVYIAEREIKKSSSQITIEGVE